MDWAFIFQVVGAGGVGVAALFFAARFTPEGTARLRRWTFWSMPVGTVTPGLLIIARTLSAPERSDHPALFVVLLLLGLAGAFFASCLLSMFLTRPERARWRFA